MKFNKCLTCGSSKIEINRLEGFYDDDIKSFYAMCTKCGIKSYTAHNYKSAIENWNNENPIKKTMHIKDCCRCGSSVQLKSFDFMPKQFVMECLNKTCNNRLDNFNTTKEEFIEEWNKINSIKEQQIKLNNCSKCGSSDVQMLSRDHNNTIFTISCKRCTNFLNEWNTTKEEVINKWDTLNPIKETMHIKDCCRCGSSVRLTSNGFTPKQFTIECLNKTCNNRLDNFNTTKKEFIEQWNKMNSIIKEELKMNNCSKCGNTPKLKYLFGEINPRHYFVKCEFCNNVSEYEYTEIDGIKNWNNENPIKKTKLEDRPKTIFTDLDGCLIKHCGNVCEQHLLKGNDILLPDTLEKIKEWDLKGYRIIITTGRKESTRTATEKQLSELGILYDQLIMGITGGIRVIINDTKPNNDTPTCVAINVQRNKGLEDIEV